LPCSKKTGNLNSFLTSVLRPFFFIYKIIIYGNIFVTAAIASLLFSSFAIFNLNPDWHLTGFICASSLLIYSLHKLVGLRVIREQTHIQEKLEWSSRNIKLFFFFSVISVLAICFFSFRLSFNVFVMLSIPAILSAGYVIPFRKNLRLRDIPYIKVFLIGISIAYVTVLLPVINAGKTFSGNDFFFFLEKFFFITAISIPFDIRDIKHDRAQNLKTLPITLGVNKSKHLSFLFLLSGVIILFFFCDIYNFFIPSYLLAAALIYFSDESRSEFYYSFLLESVMLVNGLGGIAIIYF
jgi:4-hydroxybenzoate polyprenyltransferase